MSSGRSAAVRRDRYIEGQRMGALTELLADLARTERTKALIGRLNGHGSATPRLETFLAWAEQYVRSREEALTPNGIERLFERSNLFGEVTPEHRPREMIVQIHVYRPATHHRITPQSARV